MDQVHLSGDRASTPGGRPVVPWLVNLIAPALPHRIGREQVVGGSCLVDVDVMRVVMLAAVIALAGAVGVWRRWRDGRVRTASGAEVLDADALRVPLGERATLVQFSTDFCQPCKAAHRVLAATAAAAPGVAHVEVDAAVRDDLVRRFGVRRTPTVLVLDPAGRVVGRTSGVPAAADVEAALGVLR
jgi:thiol-disulfide isomerase/thioredoxin